MPAIQEQKSYDFIIKLIYDRCRVRLHDGKQALIKARLGKRMRHLGIATLEEYCDYLRRGEDEQELTHVTDALTTNFTSFLREREHFDYLVGTALPATLAGGARRFNVWSAACATGEEPYTIGFFLSEHYPLHEGWDWRILATDISTKALDKAQQGIYPEERLHHIPSAWQRRFFQRGSGQWAGYYRIKPALVQRVEFRQVNLLEVYRFTTAFEVIFCRNVMIYFDRETQQQLVGQFLRHLVPGGYLITGHAESLHGLCSGLRCLRPSVYQKE